MIYISLLRRLLVMVIVLVLGLPYIIFMTIVFIVLFAWYLNFYQADQQHEKIIAWVSKWVNWLAGI